MVLTYLWMAGEQEGGILSAEEVRFRSEFSNHWQRTLPAQKAAV